MAIQDLLGKQFATENEAVEAFKRELSINTQATGPAMYIVPLPPPPTPDPSTQKSLEEIKQALEIEKAKAQKLQQDLEEAKKVTQSVDQHKTHSQILQQQMDALQNELKAQKEALEIKERQTTIYNSVSKALIANGFRDEELADLSKYENNFTVFEGKVVSKTNTTVDVDTYIKDIATKQPYLLKPAVSGGLSGKQGGVTAIQSKPVDQLNDVEKLQLAVLNDGLIDHIETRA